MPERQIAYGDIYGPMNAATTEQRTAFRNLLGAGTGGGVSSDADILASIRTLSGFNNTAAVLRFTAAGNLTVGTYLASFGQFRASFGSPLGPGFFAQDDAGNPLFVPALTVAPATCYHLLTRAPGLRDYGIASDRWDHEIQPLAADGNGVHTYPWPQDVASTNDAARNRSANARITMSGPTQFAIAALDSTYNAAIAAQDRRHVLSFTFVNPLNDAQPVTVAPAAAGRMPTSWAAGHGAPTVAPLSSRTVYADVIGNGAVLSIRQATASVAPAVYVTGEDQTAISSPFNIQSALMTQGKYQVLWIHRYTQNTLPDHTVMTGQGFAVLGTHLLSTIALAVYGRFVESGTSAEITLPSPFGRAGVVAVSNVNRVTPVHAFQAAGQTAITTAVNYPAIDVTGGKLVVVGYSHGADTPLVEDDLIPSTNYDKRDSGSTRFLIGATNGPVNSAPISNKTLGVASSFISWRLALNSAEVTT